MLSIGTVSTGFGDVFSFSCELLDEPSFIWIRLSRDLFERVEEVEEAVLCEPSIFKIVRSCFVDNLKQATAFLCD